MKAVFSTKKHELNVTTYQMVVLLLFNENPKQLGFKEIQDLSGIPIPDLKRALFSLSCGKARILTKSPTEKTSPVINETDTFQFNSNFKCEL